MFGTTLASAGEYHRRPNKWDIEMAPFRCLWCLVFFSWAFLVTLFIEDLVLYIYPSNSTAKIWQRTPLLRLFVSPVREEPVNAADPALPETLNASW